MPKSPRRAPPPCFHTASRSGNSFWRSLGTPRGQGRPRGAALSGGRPSNSRDRALSRASRRRGKMAADSSDGEEDLVNYGTALQPLQEGKGARPTRLDYSAFLVRAAVRVSGCPGGAACRNKAARPRAGAAVLPAQGPCPRLSLSLTQAFTITCKPCAVPWPCSTLVFAAQTERCPSTCAQLWAQSLYLLTNVTAGLRAELQGACVWKNLRLRLEFQEFCATWDVLKQTATQWSLGAVCLTVKRGFVAYRGLESRSCCVKRGLSLTGSGSDSFGGP